MKTWFTLEHRFERGALLKFISDVVTQTVQVGVPMTFMNKTWTANLNPTKRDDINIITVFVLFFYF